MKRTSGGGRGVALGIVVLSVATVGIEVTAGQQIGPPDVPNRPLTVVNAVETARAAPLVLQASPDVSEPPAHPPIHLIPPMPMPMPEPRVGPAASSSAEGGRPVMYDPATRQTFVWSGEVQSASEFWRGGGYAGVDGAAGAGEILPLFMFSPMSIIAAADRALHPWRMNVKIVMRFGTNFNVCSGTMRDAEVVLTAGHCLFNGTNWADQVWIYPGWDGNGALGPTPPTAANPYGWGSSIRLASTMEWIDNQDFNWDLGLVEIDRAVGMLTGWFGSSVVSDCNHWITTTVSSAGYPSEFCGTPGLHNGRDMTFWSGLFNGCVGNQLTLLTSPGCYTAIWGGQSGSGVYETIGNGHFVHAVASNGDRAFFANFARQTAGWRDFIDFTFAFIARGIGFDLQPLAVIADPTPIVAGSNTTTLMHYAVNATNGLGDGTWTYRVYLSTNDNIEPTDTLLSTQSYTRFFVPMQAHLVSVVNVTIPPGTPAGNYWIGVIYDGATDINSGNNDSDGWDAAPITVLAPDLEMTALTAPVQAQPGDTIGIFNTVQNVGTAQTPPNYVGFYLSNDSDCTVSDVFLGFRNVAALDPGQSSSVTTNVTIPGATPPGIRALCAIADDVFVLPEGNENNNTRTASISIVLPDLTVSGLVAPAREAPGALINVQFDTNNVGTATVLHAFRVGVYLSPDASCSQGLFLSSTNVGGLGVGESDETNMFVTIPADTPFSDRFICLMADDLGQVVEANEANNTTSKAIQVPSATPIVMLKVNGIDAPNVPTTGPYHLTLDISESMLTRPVLWYWAIVVNGAVYWVTPTGLSTTPAPLQNAPASPLTNATLLNLTLPRGTSITNAFFLVLGGAVVSSDVITTIVPAITTLDERSGGGL